MGNTAVAVLEHEEASTRWKTGAQLGAERMPMDGIEFIKMVREQKDHGDFVPPNKIVGCFGIVEEKTGYENIMFWSVNGYRKKRSGAASPVSMSDYNKSLLEEMFKKWN
jgi:hypothetical protein